MYYSIAISYKYQILSYLCALGDQNLPEEENLSDLQFQTVFPFG